MIDLRGRHFLTLRDYSKDEILYLIEKAQEFKRLKKEHIVHDYLKGRNIVMIFEKTSTRTRCSFEVAAHDLGMGTTYLDPRSSQMGRKESLLDTAKVLGRMYDAIEYRGFRQDKAELLAKNAGIPVLNGLTGSYHPTQMLADMLTIKEHFKHLEGLKLVFIGPTRNSVANSLLVTTSKLGIDYTACGPKELWPDRELYEECLKEAKRNNCQIELTEYINEALEGADVVYTDAWVMMGEPNDLWKERSELLRHYRVDMKMMKKAKDNAIFMHCLPAFHDQETELAKELYEKLGLVDLEVSDEVFNSERSKVFDQAEDRVHTIKALLYEILK